MSKAKKNSPVTDYAVYLLVRVIVCFIQVLSLQATFSVARGLAWVVERLNHRHRAVAADNLRQAYPDRFATDGLQSMVSSVYRHFCGLLMEIIHLPRKLHPTNWRRYLDLGEDRRLIRCLLSGRPLLIVTGHFGNWEMGGYVLALLGFKTCAVARPLDNPYLDAYLRGFREHTGQKVLAKKGDFDEMQAILARGGILATLADQDAGQRGLFVDFFGRPASTHKAIAILSLEYKVPLVVVGTMKVGDPMRYRLVTEDMILPEEYEGQPDAVKAITQRFTTALERVVRHAPEQYFWLHRRWKHQPTVRGRKRAA